MKTITTTDLAKKYSKVLKRIPKDGIVVTYRGDPIAKIVKPDRRKLKEETAKKAEVEVRKIKIDTFNEKEVDRLEHKLGKCSRCGTDGEVVEKMYVNEQGKYDGKWLCLAKCFNKDQGARKLKKTVSKERINRRADTNVDFGPSHDTF